MADPDKSNGYEDIASAFMRVRSPGTIGTAVVIDWVRTLSPGATILDLGCGSGVPTSEVLLENGFTVYGVDASPSMVSAFQTRFPSVPVQCAAVEESDFFGRRFDGVVAWGLMFLLDVEAQRKLVEKVSASLMPRGRFLFTAPSQNCSWPDVMTGRTSVSLGREAYRTLLETAGMTLVDERSDEGENHYYFTEKR